LIDFVTAMWLGVVGASLGSFINVVAYRMPRGMSIVWGASHCPKCGHAIRPRDNVPVLGWLLLGGKCRDCRAPISPRYAVVEATLGAAFFLLAYAELLSGGANLPGGPLAKPPGALHVVWNPNWLVIGTYAYHATLLCLLLAMALIDEDRQRIPRSLIVLAFAIVAACSYRWWNLYLERTRAIRIKEWKASVDAALGAAWGSLPPLAAAAWLATRRRPAAAAMLVRVAAALGTVGGFLGLQAVVRVAILWLPLALVYRAVQRRRGRDAGYVAPLWVATFVHLLFWKQLAGVISW
jgi:leader peptidase (prepilin peptidase)/N-methyltransferase